MSDAGMRVELRGRAVFELCAGGVVKPCGGVPCLSYAGVRVELRGRRCELGGGVAVFARGEVGALLAEHV